MSKVSALYHIVISTKYRSQTIPMAQREQLYIMITSIVEQFDCKILRINGISNHIHILLHLHPSVALSILVREIKSKTSSWLVRSPDYPHFQRWSKEYFASTISQKERDAVAAYIDNQESHHKTVSFESELDALFRREGLTLHPKDFME